MLALLPLPWCFLLSKMVRSAQILPRVPSSCFLHMFYPVSSVRQDFTTLHLWSFLTVPTLSQAAEKWLCDRLLNSYVFPPRQESSLKLCFCTVQTRISIFKFTDKKKDSKILISEAANVYAHTRCLTYF